MNSSASISIRSSHPADVAALWRLATLDSALLPDGPLLVAEQGGDVVAAISLATGATIADPFRRSASVVDLLRIRADQLRGAPRRHRGLLRRPALAHLAQ
jgi:hypothetical protein